MTFSKLGTDTDTGQIVELPQASRRQGLYIIGANGTGKTGLIEHLILQDIDQGLGVGLLDPHGDLTNAILAKMTKREDDVILLDIQDEDHPFGLNIFECPNPQSPTAVQKIVDLVMHIFEKLYDVSRQTPRMAQFLRNCTHTLVANPGYTMADIPLLLQDGECRRNLVAQVQDPQVRLFWQTYNALKPSEQFDRAESTINKMDELLQPLPRNIVGQAKTTVNIQQVMDERKILLVKLSAQLDQVTSLVGTLFIALFLNAAYSRASIPINKRKQFNLYADEFQRFATEDFATLLTEARKFGIATTIAHQARYQPGMTDGIRAVSLQAANYVVFRVTSLDADELAGGFDITPQAAWEEEIAKEWVEVLKPEWVERREEEVIDGEEEIKTPVKDVVQHLLNGMKGSHIHPVITAFVNGTLADIKRRDEELKRNLLSYSPAVFEGCCDALNNLFYTVMIQNNPLIFFPRAHSAYLRYSPFVSVIHGLELSPFTILFDISYDQYHPNYHSPGHPRNQQEFNQAYDAIELMWRNPIHSHNYLAGWTYLQTKINEFLADQQSKSSNQQHYQQYSTYVTQQKNKLVHFLEELKQVVQVLATPQGRIEAPSGLTRPHKRKQINFITHARETLTHPRKVIMHPQRTYQDVQKDIANQLSGFPNYTARVRLSEIVSHNPGKKCLHCKLLNNPGAKFCRKCGKKLPAPNEYTFTTLKPLGGIGKAALQQRLTTIQNNNIQKGYVQDRTKVEAEISQRQTSSSSGSAPAQPQKPQPQPQYARQVPVQGHCPKCNATNPRGSKFCNQCGTKL